MYKEPPKFSEIIENIKWIEAERIPSKISTLPFMRIL